MVESKGWEWNKANQSPWLKPTDEVYYLANKWSELGYKKILDLGAGLGRHSIYFAQQGFEVSAFDISEYGVNYLKDWANKENLDIDVVIGDMVELPYKDNSFDCIFAYHSISHADTQGIKQVISEMERVLIQGGEIYTSMCSKASWEFSKSEFPRVDENTVIKKEDGPENDVPHFYVNREDILSLYHHFTIDRIRHTDYCFINGEKTDIKHYYINANKK